MLYRRFSMTTKRPLVELIDHDRMTLCWSGLPSVQKISQLGGGRSAPAIGPSGAVYALADRTLYI